MKSPTLASVKAFAFFVLVIVCVQVTKALPGATVQARLEPGYGVTLVRRRPLASAHPSHHSSTSTNSQLPPLSDLFAGHTSPDATATPTPSGSGRNSPTGHSPLPSPLVSPPPKMWKSQPPSPSASPSAQEARLPPAPGQTRRKKKKWAWFTKENNSPPAAPGYGAGGRAHQLAKTGWAAKMLRRPHH